jgi:hypothetical protein
MGGLEKQHINLHAMQLYLVTRWDHEQSSAELRTASSHLCKKG